MFICGYSSVCQLRQSGRFPSRSELPTTDSELCAFDKFLKNELLLFSQLFPSFEHVDEIGW